jgi:hypothetical protein
MYIRTIVSISTVAIVAIIAGSLDYGNYLNHKEVVCTENINIISNGSSEKSCRNGHQEVFKQPNGYYLVHCSCTPITTSCSLPEEPSVGLSKIKSHPYGLDNKVF